MSEELIREIINENRYLTLATTDGTRPWIAPLEYMVDEDLNFVFFSTTDSLHVRHIENNAEVSVAIFDRAQPEYTPDVSTTLRGVQMKASARRLSEDEYPDAVKEAIAVLQLPMPPYGVFIIEPSAFFIPKIVDGINERVEIPMP